MKIVHEKMERFRQRKKILLVNTGHGTLSSAADLCNDTISEMLPNFSPSCIRNYSASSLNYLVCSVVGIGQITAISKSHDKKYGGVVFAVANRKVNFIV